MSYLPIRFPDSVKYGLTIGPGFSTSIIELDSGEEERVSHWESSLRTGTAGKDVSQDEIHQVLSLVEVTLGAGISFRLKNWIDYATSSSGVTHGPDSVAVGFGDSLVGTGDGTTQVFQMKKVYTFGNNERARVLTAIIDSTTRVGFDSGGGISEQLSGWSVNIETGHLTITPAPGAGVDVYIGCEYDTVVRFDESTDLEGLQAVLIGWDHVEIPTIGFKEVRSETSITENQNPGGSMDHGTILVDTLISQSQGKVHTLGPTSVGLSVLLPMADDLPDGGPVFLLKNTGSESLGVENLSGQSAGDIPVSQVAELWITSDALGVKSWVFFG